MKFWLILVVCFYISGDLLAFGGRSVKVLCFGIFEHLNVLRPECLPCCTADVHVLAFMACLCFFF